MLKLWFERESQVGHLTRPVAKLFGLDLRQRFLLLTFGSDKALQRYCLVVKQLLRNESRAMAALGLQQIVSNTSIEIIAAVTNSQVVENHNIALNVVAH